MGLRLDIVVVEIVESNGKSCHISEFLKWLVLENIYIIYDRLLSDREEMDMENRGLIYNETLR